MYDFLSFIYLFIYLFYYLFFIQVISKYLRLDKGTETGHMATIHAFLRQEQDEEADTVFYGPSTNNKERQLTKHFPTIKHQFGAHLGFSEFGCRF